MRSIDRPAWHVTGRNVTDGQLAALAPVPSKAGASNQLRFESAAASRILERTEPHSVRRSACGARVHTALDFAVGTLTVREAVRWVLSKLGVRDRTQAVVWAYRSGFVSA